MKNWSMHGMRPTRDGFGEGILLAAQNHPELVVLGADITASVGLEAFAKTFPERFVSLGIAEQNCVGVAAGLALGGKIPVFATYAVFAALRAADQIRISLCYNRLHVIIGGAHAGISVGPDGATHQALEDLALMRALPHMQILSPCDATQASRAVQAAVSEMKGPVYIRFGREAVPDFTPPDFPFVPGEAQILQEGRDITLVATGHMVWEALQAAELLAQDGIAAAVVNMHTLKPADTGTLIRMARKTGCVVTAEEHQVAGGLGSLTAEILSLHCPVPMAMVGMQDSFGESGPPADLMEKYGLTARGIFTAALNLVKHKRKIK